MYKLGFRGIFLVFNSSEQCDSELSIFSKCAFCEIDFPQESIIGPLVFLFFINDLPEFISNKSVIMFTDDSSVVVSAISVKELNFQLQLVLRRFEECCRMFII